MSSPSPLSPAVKEPTPKTRFPWLLAGLLTLLLLIHIPTFVCMPPDADVSEWDLCARAVLRGEVMYRDARENNLPGMLWLHLLLRPLVGWSSEAFRIVDLVIVGTIIVLMTRWLPAGTSLTARLATATLLVGFYFTTSEWCHCQRDPWMLLFALLALALRYQQVKVLRSVCPGPRSDAPSERREGHSQAEQFDGVNAPLSPEGAQQHSPGQRPGLVLPFTEGSLWALAFWIKPFIAVPALLCWVVSVVLIRRAQPRLGWLLVDGLMILVGGITVGASGMAWLVCTGAWTDFWEIMLVWNPQYATYTPERSRHWLYLAGMLVRLFPWLLVHIPAVWLATADLWRTLRSPSRLVANEREVTPDGGLFSALYLGWLVQASLLQRQHDYIHIPALMLAFVVLCRHLVSRSLQLRPRGGLMEASGGGKLLSRLLVGLLLLSLALRLPALTLRRVQVWKRCLQEGSTAEVRDRLRLLRREQWTDLARVRTFLQKKQVRDGELTCFNMRTLPLYLDLNLKPATRNFLLHNILVNFEKQREQVHTDLANSNQRYVVCDVVTTPWQRPGHASPTSSNPAKVPIPQDRLVFRAGRYAVYAVDGPAMPGWLQQHMKWETRGG